jgi:hypothetical protein
VLGDVELNENPNKIRVRIMGTRGGTARKMYTMYWCGKTSRRDVWALTFCERANITSTKQRMSEQLVVGTASLIVEGKLWERADMTYVASLMARCEKMRK